MSGIELKPCGGTDASQSNILMPLGKSTVGRGALLGIADNTVSINHGLIDVQDCTIKIMPTHTNPTFYQAKGGTKLSPLEKDIWQTLQHGDKIGLTPDQHIFEIIIHDRPINPSTQSLQASSLESEGENSPQKPSMNTEETIKKPKGQQNGDDKIADEEDKPKVAGGEKKEVQKSEETKDEEEEGKDEDGEDQKNTNGDADPDKENIDTVKLEDGKEVALPTQNERTLPNWMAKSGKEDKQEKEKPDDAVPQSQESKKGKGRPKGSTNKPKAKKGRGRPPKWTADDDDEYMSPSKKGPSREKRKKYSDDYLEDDEEEYDEPKVAFKDDDDWVLSEEHEEESEISDWEASLSQTPKKERKAKKTPGKRGRKPGSGKAKKTPKPLKEPTRRNSSRAAKEKTKSYAIDSEEEFLYDDEIYVPKPTKRTAGRTQKRSYKDDSEEEEDYSPVKTTTPKKKGRGRERPKKKPNDYGADSERDPPPQPSSRPKREAAQKKAVVIQGDRSSLLHSGVSDDDGTPNTYDDNNSFLDDAIMGSVEEDPKDQQKAGSEDLDWSPGGDEIPKKARSIELKAAIFD